MEYFVIYYCSETANKQNLPKLFWEENNKRKVFEESEDVNSNQHGWLNCEKYPTNVASLRRTTSHCTCRMLSVTLDI